jgi:hypothetical protein
MAKENEGILLKILTIVEAAKYDYFGAKSN